MLKDFLTGKITSKAGYVEYGYGQVEPNHLSAQRNGQIYAQLPADAAIDVLEQGQFVKYDYRNGLVNFTGAGEWMLVYNEIKLYRDHQADCEFALKKDDYQARIYSPLAEDTNFATQSRYYNGKDAAGNTGMTLTFSLDAANENITDNTTTIVVNGRTFNAGEYTVNTTDKTISVTYAYDDVTAGTDMYEIHYNEDPYHIESGYTAKKMPAGTTMVPRVFKTMIGDIMTTNTIKEDTVALGDVLTPGTDGILTKTGASNADMQWQVVKLYTMPDHQKGVKIMRIA